MGMLFIYFSLCHLNISKGIQDKAIGKMKIGIKVGDVMTRQLVAVKPSEDVINCAKEMASHDIGLIVVEKAGKLVGVLTERDVIWALTKKDDLRKVKAGDIMLRKITTIKPSRDIYEALVRMKKQNVKWLPITVNKKVIGMLTLNDILKIEPTLFDIARGNLHVREVEEKMKRKLDISELKESESEERIIEDGECENCGSFGILDTAEGRMLCEGCKLDIESGFRTIQNEE